MSSVEEFFSIVPDKYKKTRGELGMPNYTGNDDEKFISLDGLKYLRNRTTDPNVRSKLKMLIDASKQ